MQGAFTSPYDSPSQGGYCLCCARRFLLSCRRQERSMLAPCFARHSHVHRSSKPCRASFSPEEVDPVSFLHTCVLLEDPLSPVFCEADLYSSSPALLVPSSSRDPVSLLEAVVRPAHPSFSIYPVAVSPLAWHPFGVLESYCAQRW